jgi:phosphoglycolate phosphatase-like HAD superfamily hydrolase
MSGDYIESGDRAFQRALERLNLESDDEGSITSVDAGTPDNLICRGLFEASHASHSDEEHVEDNYEDTGSDVEEDDEGSQRSLDFTQSPRAEEGELFLLHAGCSPY